MFGRAGHRSSNGLLHRGLSSASRCRQDQNRSPRRRELGEVGEGRGCRPAAHGFTERLPRPVRVQRGRRMENARWSWRQARQCPRFELLVRGSTGLGFRRDHRGAACGVARTSLDRVSLGMPTTPSLRGRRRTGPCSVWDRGNTQYVAYSVGNYGDGKFNGETWRRLTYGPSLYAPSLYADSDSRPCMTFWMRDIQIGARGGPGHTAFHTECRFRVTASSRTPHPDVASRRAIQMEPGGRGEECARRGVDPRW